jgi:hypothetical protein
MYEQLAESQDWLCFGPRSSDQCSQWLSSLHPVALPYEAGSVAATSLASRSASYPELVFTTKWRTLIVSLVL